MIVNVRSQSIIIFFKVFRQEAKWERAREGGRDPGQVCEAGLPKRNGARLYVSALPTRLLANTTDHIIKERLFQGNIIFIYWT